MNKMSGQDLKPPGIPEKLLNWFLKEHLKDEILGDLHEYYHLELTDKPRWKRNLLYWFHFFQFIRPFALKKLEGTQKLNYCGMLKHNLKIGWRNMLKSKSFSLINILGLSSGAAVCLITLVFYRYETSFDSHHKQAEQMFRVVQHTQFPDGEFYWNTTAYPLAAALRSDFPDFKQVTQTAGPMKRLFSMDRMGNQTVRFEEDHVLFVDKFYPQVFDFEWMAGDPKTALNELNAVVITDKIAKKCFGSNYDPSLAVGHTLMLNNKDPLIIRGVIQDPPANINLKANMLVSYEFFKKHNPYPTGNWSGNYRGSAFVVLKDINNEKNLERQINQWKSKYLNENDNQRISYFLQPISEIHTETKYGSVPGGYQISKKVLDISLIVAGFILLIAIVNFINLVTARSSTRSKEVGIKKIIGGNKSIIINQFFVENSLLVIISFVLAICITIPLLDWLNDFLSIIHIQLALGLNDVSIALALCAGVVLLASVYPAILLASFSPIRILNKAYFKHRKNGLGFRRGLTFAQFCLVQIFVIAAIIIGLQLQYFQNKDLGFSTEKVVMIPIPSEDKTELFKTLLSEKVGYENISIGSGPPMAVEDFALGTRYRFPHEDDALGRSAEMKITDSSYFKMYDLQLIAGRNFIENKHRFDEFIVNRRLVESLNLTPEEAIGKTLQINEGQATIVGVMEDFHNHSLQNELTPVVLMNWKAFMWKAFIKIPSFNALIAIEETWKEAFPSSIFDYRFVDDAIEREYVIEQLIFTGFKIFSILVIIIGCLGLFGLISFLTLQKTKEVGIRKVLGASMTQILSLFTKEYSRLILIAFIVAAPLTWYFMNEWLSSFTYHISLHIWMFAAGGLLTLILAGSVTLSRSLATARANPVESLRNE